MRNLLKDTVYCSFRIEEETHDGCLVSQNGG